MTNETMILLAIIVPFAAALIGMLFPERVRWVREIVTLLATAFGLYLAIVLFRTTDEVRVFAAWLPFGINIDFRLYHFSKFILLAASSFSFLLAIYSAAFMRGKDWLRLYYPYFLFTAAFSYGAVLSNNFVLMLVFWGALLIPLYGIIAIGRKGAWVTAAKSLIIVGVSDLALILGIAIAASAAGSFTMTDMKLALTSPKLVAAFILMMTGAAAKAGAMPFHTWIPDAALDAPLPVMAYIPAALEKLLGIYLLSRVALDFFKVTVSMNLVLLTLGAVTIVFAVAMALVQKDYKRLLSYHAISQVGYMILGIGTGNPIGIAGGIFHMLNHSMYKCTLFLTGGSVEHRTGTTDLSKLGGLARNMPVTFICFAIAALSISGFPGFNGFFSKELVFEGAVEFAKESGNNFMYIFYIAAEVGAVLTFASFLKLGHAAFLGKRDEANAKVKESPLAMLVPMVTLAAGCIIFGLWNQLPLKNLIEPILPADAFHGHHLGGGINVMSMLFWVSIGALTLGFLSHLFGVLKSKSALHAADHIHYAPGLKTVYSLAEKRYFDPYDVGLKVQGFLAQGLFMIDRANNWIFDKLLHGITVMTSNAVKRAHTGLFGTYLSWALAGVGVIIALLVWVLK
ncbi:MAG: NADH-quinone oxidoreductase subunit L [Spirochaetes bacterium]|nr:NADH-quinone oxidoreductase subunit L [Spirochaetota bacterium]